MQGSFFYRKISLLLVSGILVSFLEGLYVFQDFFLMLHLNFDFFH